MQLLLLPLLPLLGVLLLLLLLQRSRRRRRRKRRKRQRRRRRRMIKHLKVGFSDSEYLLMSLVYNPVFWHNKDNIITISLVPQWRYAKAHYNSNQSIVVLIHEENAYKNNQHLTDFSVIDPKKVFLILNCDSSSHRILQPLLPPFAEQRKAVMGQFVILVGAQLYSFDFDCLRVCAFFAVFVCFYAGVPRFRFGLP